MHQTDMVEWDEPDAGEAAMPPPQMVLDIETNDVLQLTVSKTVLDVFTNLSQVCQSVTGVTVCHSQVCQPVTGVSVCHSQVCQSVTGLSVCHSLSRSLSDLCVEQHQHSHGDL